MLKSLIFILLSYYVFTLYSEYLRKAVLVYIRTQQPNSDIKCLKLLRHTDSVYKIIYNIDDHLRKDIDAETHAHREKWNYIVLALGFDDEHSREMYVSTLRHFDFVEEVNVVNITPWPFPAHHAFNIFMNIWKPIGELVGYIPKRTLRKSSSPAFKCKDRDDLEKVVIFNLLHIRDDDIFAQYAIVMFTKIFPAINSHVYYSAQPETNPWTELSVVKYENHAAACELAESEVFEKVIHVKRNCVPESFSFLTKEVH